MQNSGTVQKYKLRTFKDTFRKNRKKITPQRMMIYKNLISSQGHLSATDLYKKVKNIFSNISLNTINDNLSTFNKMGLLKVVGGSGDVKRFDSNLVPHHHFRCVTCDRITDFYNENIDTIEVGKELTARFTITNKKLYLEGVCDRCKKAGKKGGNNGSVRNNHSRGNGRRGQV